MRWLYFVGLVLVVPTAPVTERALFPAFQVILTPSIMTRKANYKAHQTMMRIYLKDGSDQGINWFVLFIKVPRSERLISSSGLIINIQCFVHTIVVPALSHICLKDFFQIA
ncbi:uncharacterized protein BKA55DRAFT_556094 [Fusarium redolens]|uniref:Secreted protein n=1 Tax=Fusarium redolens TaxID=48865 RepID=A0A9P9R6W4_FUSRE|nr:uncharacterized protein BKA55DRAFT_556094 [Fusarium redolens]KAH7267578.1 hypothetical protein BKA55DRAFT_556094 [Fusarium redolens]